MKNKLCEGDGESKWVSMLIPPDPNAQCSQCEKRWTCYTQNAEVSCGHYEIEYAQRTDDGVFNNYYVEFLVHTACFSLSHIQQMLDEGKIHLHFKDVPFECIVEKFDIKYSGHNIINIAVVGKVGDVKVPPVVGDRFI